jgi:integrase/recombinase XerD
MPHASEIECRNRALIAFTLLTGARDGAIASLKLRHVDLQEGKVLQDAREVRTKFSKSFTTWFFPVGDEPLAIVRDWVRFLTEDKHFGPADPLFPKTRSGLGHDLRFEAVGLSREHWATAAPIRQIFKDAFAAAGLPYVNPHKLPEHARAACRTALLDARAIQGVEPEPWP